MSIGSVISRGICRILVGNTAVDPSFAALDRFFLFTSIRIAGGRIRRVVLMALNGATWRNISALMALRRVSRAHNLILILTGVMLNDQYS